jgi:hypothetical protein
VQTRKFIPVDPDVEDQRQRWDDRDHQRWDLVAQAVMQVSRALAAGEWEWHEDESNHGLVRIDAEELTGTEKKIVRKWFSADEPVRMDPWFEPLQNGRYRLRSTLDFFGSEPVPIKGDVVGYANPLDAEVLGKDWQQLFARNVDEERRRARGRALVRRGRRRQRPLRQGTEKRSSRRISHSGLICRTLGKRAEPESCAFPVRQRQRMGRPSRSRSRFCCLFVASRPAAGRQTLV